MKKIHVEYDAGMAESRKHRIVRRTVWALAVLLSGCIALWAILPRHDPRFVGTWTTGHKGSQVITFREDGTGSVQHFAMSWRVDGTTLYLDYNRRDFRRAIEILIGRLLGGRTEGEKPHVILDLQPDGMRLRDPEGSVMALDRSPAKSPQPVAGTVSE